MIYPPRGALQPIPAVFFYPSIYLFLIMLICNPVFFFSVAERGDGNKIKISQNKDQNKQMVNDRLFQCLSC